MKSGNWPLICSQFFLRATAMSGHALSLAHRASAASQSGQSLHGA